MVRLCPALVLSFTGFLVNGKRDSIHVAQEEPNLVVFSAIIATFLVSYHAERLGCVF